MEKPERSADTTDEASLAKYFEQHVAEGKQGLRYLLKRPRDGFQAFLAMSRLPRLVARTSDRDAESIAVRDGLVRPPVRWRSPIHEVTSVIVLPSSPEEYAQGASKQTLRRKARAATRAGVRWVKVDDLEERRRLLQIASEHERSAALAEYRTADPDNTHLLGVRLWLAAYAADDEPLLLSVTPVDGEWAVLRYFRSISNREEASTSRYLMTQILVEHLVAVGAKYLADPWSPVNLPAGLRHFQRMVGFRLVRVRLERAGRS